MNVHVLPLPARPAPAPSASARPAFTYGLGEIARRTGVERRSDTWVLGYVRALIATEGFPLPLPRRLRAAIVTGMEAVCASARWDRRAVDAWLDGLLPPAARLALTDVGADELDHRADSLDALLKARKQA